MDLAEIKARSEALRTFPHKVGKTTFTLHVPPIAEAGQTVLGVLRAEPGKESREAALAMLVDSVQSWDVLTAGDILLEANDAPVSFSREACEQVFLDRPDYMKSIGDAIVDFIVARYAKIESERKNSESTS